MTDLPQLEQALVAAARRRNQRARTRSAVVRMAAAAAIAIGAVTVINGGEPEREIPATPAPSAVSTARQFADRFAVLRDASRPTCNTLDAGPGSRSYLVHRQGRLRFCISVGQTICANTYSVGGGFSGGCMDPPEQRKFAEGRNGAATVPMGDGDLIYAIVPDRTRDATLTYRDGTTESLPIEKNFLGVVVDKPPAKVSWTTPAGERFTSRLE